VQHKGDDSQIALLFCAVYQRNSDLIQLYINGTL